MPRRNQVKTLPVNHAGQLAGKPFPSQNYGDFISTGSVRLLILQTKLYRPPTTEDRIPRYSLTERLKLAAERPLTLVCALAGYGKSALLSAWLERCGCPSAWLTLDENDNDLGPLVGYFLAALRSAIPSFGGEL